MPRVVPRVAGAQYFASVTRGLAGIGVVLVVIGLVMVPLPGPGWLVMSLGLVVLAATGLAHLSGRLRTRSR